MALGQADVSVVDHMPEELLNLTLSGLRLEYASGIGPEGTFASFRLNVAGLQLDDQMPFSRCPQGFRLQGFSLCDISLTAQRVQHADLVGSCGYISSTLERAAVASCRCVVPGSRWC